MIDKFSDLFKRFFDSEKVAGLLLVFCTIISLLIANSLVGETYVHLIHSKIDASIIHHSLALSLEQWINDGLMTIFFLMVGLEVERELYTGELSDIKKAILPVVAAVGGMIVPSAIHFLFNHGTDTQAGFAIPMATDIAFALGILSLAGDKVPVSVKVFLAALAIIDDIGAIVVIAFFYTKTISFLYLLGALLIFAALLALNRLKVTKLIFYLIPAVFMWYCFLRSGVHPTLSGVLLAFAIPFHQKDEPNVSLWLQNFLNKPVAFFIVPIFAIVNTAIILPSNVIASISNVNSAGIIGGLFIGKMVGIVCFPLMLVKAGKASFQEGITMPSLIGLGFLGGIGFTMSMFISNLAFDNPDYIITSKLSILLGSTISALTGLAVLKFVHREKRQKVAKKIKIKY
jgi:NhaA family Na+:H+ antiporter